MVSTKKFYKTTITVVVLSEEPYDLPSLGTVAYDVVEGACAGSYETTKTEVLDGKEMAVELMNNASDPEFFQLTEDGEDMSD